VTADPVSVVFAGGRGAMWSPQRRFVGSLSDVVAEVGRAEARDRPRWVWWSAAADAEPLVRTGLHLARCWDVAEAHRILVGGWTADPAVAWTVSRGLDPGTAPAPRTGDLFDLMEEDVDEVVLPGGHLNPAVSDPTWLADGERLLDWARAAHTCAAGQAERLRRVSSRAEVLVHSESAAALLCVELSRDGLPIDREVAERLIAEAAGPRPVSEADAVRIRRERDAVVLAHAPGHEDADLRNPLQVRTLLASVGVDVPSTRKWVLDGYRDVHPLVPALLAWRAEERIATTYGYRWLDEHVGPDDRLRGEWTACDGAAGRMTAQNGLHNLPAALRPAVAARPGHVLVRADLGQIEPRVLAAVSGDPAFAAATRSPDLYGPVAERLGVDRPTAKVAVLAAMYGQRSGAAGEALAGLERSYPTAMAHLDRAYAAGWQRESVRTFGGRLVRMDTVLVDGEATPEATRARDAARGRFARNAVIQGSAAELFKAWAATVRATTRDLDGQIVLCLHDELLIHVRAEQADEMVRRVDAALADAARRWSGTNTVRFVADTCVVTRWSDAKE
jgi:DNA polymerase-1